MDGDEISAVLPLLSLLATFGYPLSNLCRTIAYRPGCLSGVSTAHYRRAHPLL